MTTLTTAQMNTVVNRIIALLNERERRIYAVRLHQLRTGLDPAVFVRYATLHLVLPDLPFLRLLAAGENRDPAVSRLQEALSWGMRIHISLHRQLLPALPLKPLSRLPLTLSDHQGRAVNLYHGNVLGRTQVATLPAGWLIVSRNTLITPLARDGLLSRRIQLLKQE